MGVIDKVTTQFRQRLNGELQSIDVPEWDIKVYYKPIINFKAQEKIFKLVNEGKSSEAVCMTLIIRALDEHGKQMFQAGNMGELMHEVDPDVVSSIVSRMGVDEDADVLKKT